MFSRRGRVKVLIFILSIVFIQATMAQNLLEERIWKVSPRKKSIFLDSGVFHYHSAMSSSKITGIRSSSVDGRGYERVVVDFDSLSIPKIYGHISPKDQKISVDFFGTTVTPIQTNLKNSKFVKSIDFINVDGKSLTMELALKSKASFDIFYLENPGRLVIDVR